VMGWRDTPRDLDIHVIGSSCHVYHGNLECDTHSLDVDNTRGGQAGFETVTFHNVDNHRNKTYLVYIMDWSNQPEQFSNSEAHIDIQDGIGSVRFNLQPSAGVKRYWIAGCLVVLGSQEDGTMTFTWREKGEYVSESPDIGVCTGHRNLQGNRRMVQTYKVTKPVNKKTHSP